MIHTGDCVEVMAQMEPESVDAIVTDPPYGLEFMGKEWDRLGIGETGGDWSPKWSTGKDWTGRERVRPGRLYNRSSHETCQKCRKQKHQHDAVKCPEPEYVREWHQPKQMRSMQAWHQQWAAAAYRVAKPSAYLLAFGGTRTFHRLACALEDAGWIIRDTLVWGYASGFPKSLDVSKAIDKRRDDYEDICRVALWLRPHFERVGFDVVTAAFGFKDETMARARWSSRSQPQVPTWDQWLRLKDLCGFGDEMDAEVWRLNGRKGTPGEAWDQREVIGDKLDRPGYHLHASPGGVTWSGMTDSTEKRRAAATITAAASDLAKKWEGWGTALKPAWEPIVMARKPGPGTVVDSVLRYGTGAINIDATRIGGRWPANIVLTDPIFDGGWEGVVGGGDTGPAGVAVRRNGPSGSGNLKFGSVGGFEEGTEDVGYGDSGTYSRFFILPKADRQDREPILDEYAYRLHRERGECGKLSAWAGADLSRSEQTDSTSPERAISAVILPATPTDSSSGTSSRGKPRTDPSPTDTRSTTSTATSKTTGSTISSSSILSPTSGSTRGASSETASGGSPAPFAESSSGLGLTTGTSPERAGRSTDGAVPATSGSSSSRNVCGRCGKPLPRVGSHPTVKPTDLMRHLVRLVTPAGGVVLDPFLGSGTTALAAEMEGFAWIGIEREAEYVAIAEARLNGTQRGLAL